MQEQQNIAPVPPPPPTERRVSIWRWIGRAIGWVLNNMKRIVILLCVFLLLTYLLLQSTTFQNFAIQRATEYLSKELNTSVKIGHVDIGIFDHLTLDDLYVQDKQGDTLLFCNKLAANFDLSIPNIYKQYWDVKDIKISEAKINLKRRKGEKDNNLQFLIDYFDPPKPYDPLYKKKPIDFHLRSVALDQVNFVQDDEVKGQKIDAWIPRGKISVSSMDLIKKNLVELDEIMLDDIFVHIIEKERFPLAESQKQINTPIDSLQQKKDEEKEPFHLKVKRFNINDAVFSLDNFRKSPTIEFKPNRMNYQHLRVEEINVDMRDLSLVNEVLVGEIRNINAKDQNGFELSKLSAKHGLLSPTRAELYQMQLITPHSTLGDTLIFDYDGFDAFEHFNSEVQLKGHFAEGSKINVKDIMNFAINTWEQPIFLNNQTETFDIQGAVKGSINRLKAEDLWIRLDKRLSLKAKFRSKNLDTRGEEEMDIQVDELITDKSTLTKLIPPLKLPNNLDKLGKFKFNGEFQGFFEDFVANGTFNTAIGVADVDIRLDLKQGKDRATYSGQLKLNKWDLGQWFDNKDLGLVTGKANIAEGTGITIHTINSKLTTDIASFSFKNYEYKNLKLEGNIAKNLFDGQFNIKDNNIDLGFNGTINFVNPQEPIYKFKSVINKLDLKPLNISQKDYVVAGTLDLNLKGKNLNDINGLASIKDLKINTPTENFYIAKADLSSSLMNSDFRQFSLKSDILDATLDGVFTFDDLPKALKQYFAKNYPSFASKFGININEISPTSALFDYLIKIKNTSNLTHLFDNQLDTLKDITLKGHLNTENNYLKSDINIPILKYANATFYDLVFILDDEAAQGGTIHLGVNNAQINNLKLNQFFIEGRTSTDLIQLATVAKNPSKQVDDVQIDAKLDIQDNHFHLTFEPSTFKLMNNKWAIDADNYIRFDKDFIQTNGIHLRSKDKEIVLQSINNQGLALDLNHFGLEFIDKYWDFDKFDFAGNFNAKIEVGNIFKQTDFKAFLQTDTLLVGNRYMNKFNDWGVLTINATLKDLKSRLDAYANITNGGQQLSVEGFYVLPKGSTTVNGVTYNGNFFKSDLHLTNYPLNILEYVITDGIEKTTGLITANLSAEGDIREPNVQGKLKLHGGAGVNIKYLNTRYTFDNQTATINNYMLDATGATLKDELGNTGKIYGGLAHNHLKDWHLNVRMASDRILALNTNETLNNYYYGYGLGKIDVRFSGTFPQTDIDVEAKVAKGSALAIQINYDQTASEVNFIRFEKNIESEASNVPKDLKGLNFSMKLELTDDADVELIFDKNAGDKIKGNGKGNIDLKITRNGDFTMYGDYVISKGQYLFTLVNFINKPFDIKEGGSVKWKGEPFKAIINIEAKYKNLSASLYNFIAEFNPPDIAQQPTNVDLILFLNGELKQPNVTFDIAFPNLTGELKGYTDSKLRILKQDVNELNRQVFGLIVANAFLPGTGGIIQAGNLATGINTVSELILSQITLLANEYLNDVFNGSVISGVNLDFNYNMYQGQTFTGSASDWVARNEFQVRPTVNLFKDKVTINFGLTTGTYGSSNQSYFNGDVQVELTLTEDRRWKLKAYQRPEQDLQGLRYRYGGGIVYRREFDNINEIFKKKAKQAAKLN